MQTFLQSLQSYLRPSDVEAIRSDLSHGQRASFRVNTLRSGDHEVITALKALDIVPEPFPGIPSAYTISREEEYRLKGNPLFNSGKLYMQSISSQIPVLCMDLSPGMKVLDACAAPGSKTSQIMAIMQGRGMIDALEPSPIRFAKLERTIEMLRVPHVTTHRVKLQDFHARHPDKEYDRILLDVPCSGEGRLRSVDEEAITQSLHEYQAKRALELLSIASEHLTPGGKIVFSTCTPHPTEDEMVIKRFLELHRDFEIGAIDIPALEYLDVCHLGDQIAAQIPEEIIRHSLRIRPSRRLEGFYVAVLQKQ